MWLRNVLLGLSAAMLIGLGACAASAGPDWSALPAPQRARLDAFRERGTGASLTILPVWAGDAPRGDVADAVGLILERRGMSNLDTCEAAFVRPAEATAEQLPAALREHLAQHPIRTDYALYAEYIGTPTTGVREIRAVVIDKAGELVWADRQTRDDRDFKRMKPGCPLSCSMLLSKRLANVLDLPSPEKGEPEDGKFARKWAAKSGTPDRTERSAMDDRLAAWRKSRKRATVSLYPVRLSNSTFSRDAATGLLAAIETRKLFPAVLTADELPVTLEPTHNEQKALWDLARAVREHVRVHPPATDYVLYADYWIDMQRHSVGAVHFVVCNHSGDWVIVDFQNDHHSEFTSVNPSTTEDCSELVARRLSGYLR